MSKRSADSENSHNTVVNSAKRTNKDFNSRNAKPKPNADYTVGLICAIPTEYVAAQAFLDEEHGQPEIIAPNDNNNYTLGRIGKHDVVIAVLPSGEYGIASATAVAKDLLHTFQNVTISLMVGIGGGAPSQRHDIRLGDVVVSESRNGMGAVFQYGLGKRIQGQSFHPTGYLNLPPSNLRTAVNGLKAKYKINGNHIEKAIQNVLEQRPLLKQEYERPDPSSDRLYRSDIAHPVNNDSICAVLCGEDSMSLISRSERTSHDHTPVIHYGLVASSDQLMKNAIIRDQLSAKYDVLCFEMEGAGLMNTIPCLVIRGICDYADTHKNKEWQGYAAMAAAAYAKDLLDIVPHHRVETPQGVASWELIRQRSRETERPLTGRYKSLLLDSLYFEQIGIRQMTMKKAHAKTCMWLLHTPEYRNWLSPDKIKEHCGILWLKGKPGTGKSTLMQFAYTNAQKNLKDKIIISFFFNARGANLEKSTAGMYRSLLFQLLEQRPGSEKILNWQVFSVGNHEWSVEALKTLFQQALKQLCQAGLVCFVDALDECDEDEVRDMLTFFELLSEINSCTNIGFQVCFASRHYPSITAKGLTLSLEMHVGHFQDITTYVDSELKIGQSQLANRIHFTIREKSSGVFLWAVLVVSIVNKEYDRGRLLDMDDRLKDLPGGLHDLFHNILTRDKHNMEDLLACLQWVLFAKQPLKPEQLYFAIRSSNHPGILSPWNSDELTAADMQRFILGASKGITEVTKARIPTIQFIHESVKDFLLKEDGLKQIWPGLTGKFHGKSHERLKLCCLSYYTNCGINSFLNINNTSLGHFVLQGTPCNSATLRESVNKAFPFFEYAVQNVLYHANAAEEGGLSQLDFLKDFQLSYWAQLNNMLEKHRSRRHNNPSMLYILSEYDMGNLISRYPDNLSLFQIEKERYGTPLFAALATKSNKAICSLLSAVTKVEPVTSTIHGLYKQYNQRKVNMTYLGRDFSFQQDKGVLATLAIHGDTILLNAFFLVSTDIDLDYAYCGGTALSLAARHGHEEMVSLLLEKGANLEIEDEDLQTPLSRAAQFGHTGVVMLLLDRGAELETKNRYFYSPLLWATERGHLEVIKLLLERGANIETKDENLWTPLLWATERRHEEIIMLLLENGANLETKDNELRTPLLWAAQAGEDRAVELFLDRGANLEAKDKNFDTPLLLAAKYGHKKIVRLLLENGADTTCKDQKYHRTPLDWARWRGYGAIIQLLESN